MFAVVAILLVVYLLHLVYHFNGTINVHVLRVYLLHTTLIFNADEPPQTSLQHLKMCGRFILDVFLGGESVSGIHLVV